MKLFLTYLGRLAIVALFLLFLSGVVWLFLWHSFGCEHIVIETLPGPDKMEVQAVGELCMGETIHIYLKDKNAHSKQEIFRYDPALSDPHMKWIGQNNLEITINDMHYIDLQIVKLGDVTITYNLPQTITP